MRRGGQVSHTTQVSAKSARAALTQLLHGCTPERLRGFTAQSLAGSYRVPLATVEKMLSDARQGRLV